ncbi:F-box/kelch-repeat protein At3g06240 [Lactuca sativa]|uniref:F-box/kelch-repeat protein At3g06240 n=1 Tax=Lactuca sativa TaxID=4236 RepID=UPI000CD8F93C|nr:F-box/kelch-repeat protein At3g06240 [Lactuca sativa]
MATLKDGMSPYESGGAEERFRKMPFRPGIYEEPQNVSHEAGRDNSTGASEICTHHVGNFASISSDSEISELEQMLKQMTFTRSVTQRLILLLHSRTIEESPTPLLRLEASPTSGSMKRPKHGDERDNFHASVVSSRLLEEEIAQDSKFISNNGTGLPNPITSTTSPQQPATMENLPHELLSNIFIRLFAKQLAQMRSVSKSWNAFLSHPSFVKSHLHHSIHNNDQILLIFQDEEFYSDTKPFTAIPSRSPRLELTNFIKFPVKPQSGHTDGIRVIGSVNGLICSSYDNHSVIHIWNPSLSAVLTLPPYSTPSNGYNSFKIHFRFGFDPKSNDYKVVKLTGLNGPYENVVTWWLQVEIYSMRKGSWKLITARFPSHITTITNGDDVCVDGHDGCLHWLGYDYIIENTDLKMIVAFDLGSETFREIPLPDSILNDDREIVLGVLAKKLCVMTHVGVDGTCDVWVMDKYGVAESWVKRHVFSQFDVGACLFGFTSHNEFLIVDDGHLVLYNPNTNEQIRLEGYCPEDYDVQNIMEYVDSLVWVAPAKA